MTEQTPPPSPAPARPSATAGIRRFVLAGGVLFIVWLVFGQLVPTLMFPASEPLPRREPPPTASPAPAQDDARVTELNARIEQLEAKLKTFEEIIAATPPARPEDDIRNIQPETPDENELPLPTPEPVLGEERAAQIEEKITRLKTQVEETEARSAREIAMLSATGQIKDALSRGEPFSGSLAALKEIAKDTPPVQELLARLEPFSEKGTATLTMLQAEFETAIPKALAADPHSLKGTFQSLIRVRKVGADQQGTSDDAVIARAEAMLKNAEVGNAADELAQLSPQAAPAFAAWVKHAQDHLAARRALGALELALHHD